MPEPVYLLCCQSGAEDGASGLASHFSVIDRFELTPLDLKSLDNGAPTLIFATPMRAVAVWRGTEDSDFDGEFEFELRGLFPGGPESSFLLNTFRFQREKPRQRFTIELPPPLFQTVQESGTFLLEGRIRKRGGADWSTQRYPIDIVIHRKTPETSPSSDSESGSSDTGGSPDPSRASSNGESGPQDSAMA